MNPHPGEILVKAGASKRGANGVIWDTRGALVPCSERFCEKAGAVHISDFQEQTQGCGSIYRRASAYFTYI